MTLKYSHSFLHAEMNRSRYALAADQSTMKHVLTSQNKLDNNVKSLLLFDISLLKQMTNANVIQ